MHSLLLRSACALSLLAVAACSGADAAGSAGESEDDVRSDVTPEGTVLIAFDGTGNYLGEASETIVARAFKQVVTTGKYLLKTSHAESARSAGAQTRASWAYLSYARSDDQDQVRSLYFNGPPEGPTDTRFSDSGASFVMNAALGAGLESPVCKVVRQPTAKKVFLVGYSRGAVLAHAAAFRILAGACGYGMGAKVTWLGLVDPVETGMKDGSDVFAEDCDAKAATYHVYGQARTQGCLSLLRSSTTGAPVPVSVFLKNAEANALAETFLLNTIPVNGGRHRVFDFSPVNAVQTHISMGKSGIVFDAFRKDAVGLGGLRFAAQ
jgi:hypothetical protein